MVSIPTYSLLLFLGVVSVGVGYRDPWLYCDTCLATINEIENFMSIQKKEKIQVGGFRIDKDAEKVEYTRSEVLLHEVMDQVCQVMHMYGVFTNPQTQAKHVIRAHAFQSMHTPPSKKYTKSGPEVTNSIVYACSVILEEHEDVLIDYYRFKDDEDSDIATEFCVDYANLCTEEDVQSQMWAMGEAAVLGIGGDIERPSLEKDPILDLIEIEYVDLTNEPEEEGWKAPKRPREEEEEEEEKKKFVPKSKKKDKEEEESKKEEKEEL